MELAAVVLNYNNPLETIECVAQLLALEILDLVVIVDNASTDNSIEQIQNKFLTENKAVVCASNSNRGYSTGNNIGLKVICEKFNDPYIIICNPDVRISSMEVIKELSRVLNSTDQIVAAAPLMLDRLGLYNINAWKLPKFGDDIILSSIVLTRIFGNSLNYKPEYIFGTDISYVQVLSGSFFMIKGSFLKMIGYLDENTFLYCEERILGWQIQKHNKQQVLLKDVTFNHFHSTTIKKNIRSSVKRFIILSKSRMYYQINYNKLSKGKILFLYPFIFLGICELFLKDLLDNFKNFMKSR